MFSSIVLPLSVPGVVAGCILSFSVGISAFVVPLLVGGKIGQQFLAVVVYGSMNTFQDWGLGAAASTILLVVSLGTVLVYNWLMKRLRIGVVLTEDWRGTRRVMSHWLLDRELSLVGALRAWISG